MFNKKLLAAGILAFSSSSAMAAVTFTFTPATYSTEGAASQDVFTSPAIGMRLGAEYAADDLVTLAFNTDFDDGYTLPSNLSAYVSCAGQAAGAATAAENGGVVTLGVLTNTADSVTYRVTTIDYTTTTGGAACTSGGSAVAAGSSTVGAIATFTPDFQGTDVIATGTVTGTYSATLTNGTTAIDGGLQTITNATPSSSLIAFAAQFSATAADDSNFSKVIDVTAANPRSVFTAGTVTDDTLVIGLSAATPTVAASMATGEVVTATITGDWSFIVDETPATAVIDTDAITCTIDDGGAQATTETVTATTLTVVGAAGDTGDITCLLENDKNGDGTNQIPAGTYSTAISVAYNDAGADGNNGTAGDLVAGTKAISSAAGGGWTLNGSTSVIQAYPVSSGITGFLWVTNTGASDYGMSATAVSGGSTMAECALGTAPANTLTYVTNEVETCLTAAGITSGRAQITVTVNAPAAEIDVYAAYKVDADSDRLSLTVD